MPFNFSRGMHSRTRASPLTPAEAEPCPCKVVEAAPRHVAKTLRGIPLFLQGHQISHLEPVAGSAPRKRLRLALGGFESFSEFAGSSSEDHRSGKLKHEDRNRAGGRLPARLKLHAKHSVLRKISTALRVRISPSMNVLGPYIVIDDVTSAEILIIAKIFED